MKKTYNEAQERARKAAKLATSGCPLMDGRDKANAEDFVGQELTIADVYPMTGEDGGNYFCVTVEEDNDIFFLSGGGLTKALDAIYSEFGNDVDDFRAGCTGLVFKFENMRKTKNKRDFRPVTIL